MPGRIAEEKIEEIVHAVSIVDVIGERVALRRAGQEFVGLCPFHEEKTPSFSVNPAKGLYHCHGCQAGGNTVRFLMEIERLAFPEAIENLAHRAGIDLSREASAPDARAPLRAVLAWAAQTYRNAFLSPAGEAARHYMTERGLSPETLDRFGIGWAPEGWSFLIDEARPVGHEPALLEEAGLATPRKKGEGHYDFFRGRVLFPIRDERGRVVAFGGRRLGKGDGPKYINSRHSPVYDKSKTLYGLDLARGEAARGFWIVEGYTDVMALHQAGHRNAVASLGTSFTGDQARLIQRYARQAPITLLFDSDQAGLKAAERGVESFLERDLEVRIVTLPGGRDPDQYVREAGRAAIEERVEEGQGFLDFKIGLARRRFRLERTDDQARAIDFLLATIGRIANPVKRSLSMKRVAEAFGVPLRSLDERLGQLRSPKAAVPLPPAPRVARPDPPLDPAAEEFVLQVLFYAPHLALEVRSHYPPERFHDAQLGHLAAQLLAHPPDLGEGLPDRSARLAEVLSETDRLRLEAIRERHRDDIDYDRHFRTFLQRVRERKNRPIREEARAILRQAEAEEDRERVQEVLQAFPEYYPPKE